METIKIEREQKITSEQLKHEPKTRLDYLDIAKGFAMICIIMGHMGLEKVNSFVFTFHVPIFFLISGYFLNTRLSFGDFVRKKARQLLIPYTITCICIIGGGTLKGVIETHGTEYVVETIKTWVIASLYGSGTIEYTEPFYMKQIGTLWFLPALFFALIIVRFFIPTGHTAIHVPAGRADFDRISMQYSDIPRTSLNTCPGRYGFVGVFVLAYVGWKTTDMVWLPLSVQAGMTAALFVYLGFLARRYQVLERPVSPAVISGLSGIWLICILFCGKLYMVRNYYENGLLDVIGALAGSYIVIVFAGIVERRTKYLSRLLKFYGKNSLLMMCCHAFEQIVVSWDFAWQFFGEKLKLQPFTIICSIIVLKLLFCTAGIAMIRFVQNVYRENLTGFREKFGRWYASVAKMPENQRVQYWDIAKGIAIILMILGHTQPPQYLIVIIFSFHMPFFIIANGYFIKSYDIGRTFRRSVRTLLLPYTVTCLVSAIIYTIMGAEADKSALFLHKIKAMAGGMSKISTRFQSFESVWVVWFVCCLFITRNLYVILMKLLERYGISIRIAVIFALAIAGYGLGQYYAYMPWSLDVALVSLIFIGVGDWMRQAGFFQKNYFYTLVFPAAVWIYFLVNGVYIELAMRSYPLGIFSVIEAIAGSMVLVAISKILSKNAVLTRIMSWVGRNSMIILGIHCIELMYVNWDEWVFRYLPFETNWFRVFVIKTIVILALTAVIDGIKIIAANQSGRLKGVGMRD